MNNDDRARAAIGLQELTHWAATYPPSQLPPDVLRRAAAILADDIGAMVAARDEPEVARFHAAILERAAQPRQPSSAAAGRAPIACRRRWRMPSLPAGWKSTRAIVRCRAAPACAILPALLAEAEATDRPVRDVLAALALGYEIVTRIARCWNAPALVVHTHAQYCAVGAAMGVALLRRLDPASLLNVLAMASTFVNAGPRNHALSGALVRNAWPAAGAWNGMLSVNLHECGFGGNADAPCDVYAAILEPHARQLEGDVGNLLGQHRAADRCRRGRRRRRASPPGTSVPSTLNSASWRRWARGTPPVWSPIRATPCRPWLRSTTSWAIRVTADGGRRRPSPCSGVKRLARGVGSRRVRPSAVLLSVRASQDPLHGQVVSVAGPDAP